MNHPPQPPRPRDLTEDELHAYLDGQLSPEAALDVEQRLADDQAAQTTLEVWTRQKRALEALHSQTLDEPIPPALLAAARRAQDTRQHQQHWWRWGGMAASVVLAFGMGWLAKGLLQPLPSHLAGAPGFTRQAALAHVAYSPEVRHPVEVAASEQDHLIQWLSKRLGKPLKVPDLSAEGFHLVGGRLLPGETGVRAQFMYQSDAGTRVTLYLGAVSDAATAARQETGYRLFTDDRVNGFYWVDQGFGYALSGSLDTRTLRQLAERVYHQL